MIVCPHCVEDRFRAGGRTATQLLYGNTTELGDRFRELSVTVSSIQNRQIVLWRAQCVKCGTQIIVEQLGEQDAEGTWRITRLLPS